MVSLGNDTLKACLGVVLILIALYFLFGEGKLGKLFSSRPAQMTIGSISGLMGGMFAMPGPPVVLYCISIYFQFQYILFCFLFQAFIVKFCNNKGDDRVKKIFKIRMEIIDITYQ